MVHWDCSGCWRDFEITTQTATRRFEQTTVYSPEGEQDAFVCPRCGSLLKPYPNNR